MKIKIYFVLLVFGISNVNCLFRSMLLARSTTHFVDNGECSNPTNSTKFAIIVHGWRQTCEEKYILKLTRNLENFRGGCIICMNYGVAAATKYFGLVRNVDILVEMLLEKLQELEYLGFKPANGYMYGFSYGARLVVWAGILFGHQRIGEIDVCDMAGPLFDKFPVSNTRSAAKNVQCIHTSSKEGTWGRDCHQNWNMGMCGKYQLAEENNPENTGSHGLCNSFSMLHFIITFMPRKHLYNVRLDI
uniref:Lipase domain-containing protein n=1 Tax=Megaselia scalaris TaxID=36166 RepID=T1GNU6_MEGSC